MSKKPEKLWEQIQRSRYNVKFDDFLKVVEWFGFMPKGGRGSHRTFFHPQVREILDLQELRGEAKPYQIGQLLRLVRQYNFKGGKAS